MIEYAEPSIRRLTAGDDPMRLRALRVEMLEDTPVAFAETAEQARSHAPEHWTERLRRYTDDTCACLFAAEDQGRWVALAGVHIEGDGRAWLVGVYVAPAYRGRGLLDRLVAASTAWLRAREHDELLLEVAAANTRAIAAYTRLGFRPTGRSQPHPIYREHTEIEMALAL